MNRVLFPAILAMALGLHAQTAPDAAELTKLLKGFLAGAPATVYGAQDIRIQQYGDTAIVAFRLIGTTERAGTTEINNYLNTSAFLKRNGKWQAVSWQSTKMPRPEP